MERGKEKKKGGRGGGERGGGGLAGLKLPRGVSNCRPLQLLQKIMELKK